MKQLVTLGGLFTYHHWSRVQRDGHKRHLGSGRFRNGICSAALDDLLNEYFRGTTQSPSWYLGLVDLSGFTAFAAGDTMASHAGWAENTAYVAGTRPAWLPSASSANTIINAGTVNFLMSGNATLHGLFVANNNVKGGAGGLLWATGAFQVDQQLANGESLSVSYQLTASAGAGS